MFTCFRGEFKISSYLLLQCLTVHEVIFCLIMYLLIQQCVCLQTAYLGKNSKWPQLPLRPLLIPFITLFSLLVCYTCMNQISLDKKITRSSILPVGTRQAKENVCSTNTIPSEEMGYVHFPQPKTFSRYITILHVQSLSSLYYVYPFKKPFVPTFQVNRGE